jgi:DNA-directed RNA polymerase subunit beta
VAHADIVAPDGSVIVAAGKAMTKAMWRRMIKAGIEYYEVRPESLETEFAAVDIVDPQHRRGYVCAPATP